MWASRVRSVRLKNHWLGDLGQAANPLWTSFFLSLKWVLTTSRDCCAKEVTPRGCAVSIQSDVAVRVRRCPGFEAALDAPALG